MRPLVERFEARASLPPPRRKSDLRLRRSADIRQVLRAGRRLAGVWMVLYVVPSEQGVRAAFVVRRDLGGAVRRNRVRRQLREAWRSVAPSVARPVAVVAVARPEAAEGPSGAELAAEMRFLLFRSWAAGP